MLHLQSTSSEHWLVQVDNHLNEILIDHAHCEQKAAAAAMDLMFNYVENQELCRQMTAIINEELEHFHLVLAILNARSIKFRKLRPGPYGRRLKALVRRQEPQKAIDRLLIAGLIEARSCERFMLLRDHIDDRELSRFYRDLCESEARHHATYVQLAQSYGHTEEIRQRLDELAGQEAVIIADGSDLPRMHS
ncbi:MAG: tRNA-(ms[2]io[6]A)-hydroxylase [Fuerstiella sp.]|nr:tRNA-(ms[2]io[6]A)-hydroxylase [Fuerstiella sp.]